MYLRCTLDDENDGRVPRYADNQLFQGMGKKS